VTYLVHHDVMVVLSSLCLRREPDNPSTRLAMKNEVLVIIIVCTKVV
jgi:hypothetical protein